MLFVVHKISCMLEYIVTNTSIICDFMFLVNTIIKYATTSNTYAKTPVISCEQKSLREKS